MEDIIFIVGVELSGDSKAFRNKGYAGGFVNCVTFAQNIPNALEICRKALEEDGYIIVIFDNASIYNPEDYEDFVSVLEAVERLKVGNHEVQYDNFNVYGH